MTKRLFFVFASAGDVANVLSEFSPMEWKVAGSAGLRFLISREEHLNLRFDVAVGQQTHGLSSQKLVIES